MNKLGVVTICYNDIKGLKKTIESLKSQTIHSFEHIIVDGGSDDGTPEYLAELNLPWNFTWSSEKDRGIYDAMNKGMAKISSEFIWFLNSGDTCASNTVMEEVLPHLSSKFDLVYGKAWHVGGYGKKSVGEPVTKAHFRRRMPICHQSIIYKTSIAKIHPYPLEYRIISDWIVTQTIFSKASNTKFIDLYLANFDLSGISSQNHFRVLKEKLRSESHLLVRLDILIFLGGKYFLIWMLKKIGLYRFFKKWQSVRHYS